MAVVVPVTVVTAVAVVWQLVTSITGSYLDLGLLDVQIYRMGGAAILNGQPLYEAAYAHDNLPFTYPPFAAILFVPLHVLGWTGAPVAVTLAGLAAIGRSAWLLARATAGPAEDRRRHRWTFAVLVLFALAMWPTRSTFEFGQINLVLMWLVVEDVLGAGRTARWGGVLTGVAAAVKLTPAFLIVFFAACGQYRRALNATVATAAAVAVGFVVVPADSWRYWTQVIREPSRVGDLHYLGNQSLMGVLTRALGGPPGTAVQLLVVVAVGAGALIVGSSLWRSGRVTAALAAGALGPLLLSPISWMHHWVWMLVFLAVLLHGDAGERRGRRAARLTLLGLLVVVGQPRLMNHVPNGGGREYGLSLVMQGVAGGYVLFALGLLAYLHVLSRHGAAERADEPVRPRLQPVAGE